MIRAKLLVPVAALAFAGFVAACSDGPTTPTPTEKPDLYHAALCGAGQVAPIAVPVFGPDVPAALVTALQAAATALAGALDEAEGLGIINCGQLNSLAHKLEAALEALARGQCHTAVNILNAFINEAQTIAGLTAALEPELNQFQTAVANIAAVICPAVAIPDLTP